MEGYEDLGAPSPHSRRPPLPKLTEKSAIPAKVTVRVPKDLFNSALYSGNEHLVQRSQQQQKQQHEAKLNAADILLQKSTVKSKATARRTVVARDQGTKRKFTQEFHFDPKETGVFPPRSVEWHSMEDFVDTEGDNLPTESHPYGWVPPSDVEPTAMAVRPRTGQIQTQSSTTLPLEFFDSPDMELVPPEQRLAEGRAADPYGRGPIGFSRFYNTDGEFSWSPCVVLEYDRGRDMYLIEWHSTQRTKWVKRLNLFFQNESRIGFRFRLRQARRRKEEVEREARYHEYVSHLPFRNIDVLDRYKSSILGRIGSDAPTRMPGIAHAYYEEIRQNFKKAVNSAIVDFEFNDEAAAAHLSAANVQTIKVFADVPNQGCVNFKALPHGREIVSAKDAGSEAMDLALEDFSLLLQDVNVISFMASSSLLGAMQQYYRELDVHGIKIADTELSALPLPARLADFVRVQRMHLDEVSEQLMSDWTIKVIAIVERLLPGPTAVAEAHQAAAEGEGGLTMEGDAPPPPSPCIPSPHRTAAAGTQQPGGQSALTEAQRAQVLRFVKVLSLTMADQLRTAVLGSMLEYEAFWQRYDFPPWDESARAAYPDDAPPKSYVTDSEEAKAAKAAAHPRTEDDANAVWRSNHATPKWGADLHTCAHPPLFVVQLIVRDGNLILMPGLTDVQEAVRNSFDDIITATQSIDDISVKVMQAVNELGAGQWVNGP